MINAMPSLSLKSSNISVVIPTYSEEALIEKNVKKVLTFLQSSVADFELIVVDDGSTDLTPDILNKLSAGNSRLVFVPNKKNQGKGAVVRQGLDRAQKDFVLFLDADLSTDITELNHLIKLADLDPGTDIWVSSRYLKDSRITRRQPLKRRLIGRAANLIIRLFFLPGIKDTQNGFKMFRRQKIQMILPKLSLKGWFFDVELLYAARNAGLKIKEFPITWTNRDDSRLQALRDLKKTWGEIWLFAINTLRKKYR